MTYEGAHTADGIRLLVQLLMTDLRGVDPVAVRPEAWAEPVRGWLTAGAALAAGEPKRALAALDDPVPEETYDDLVTRALRTAATATDVNWAPGGAVTWALPPGDEAALLGAVGGTGGRLAVLARDPGLRLAAFLATRHLPDVFVARAVVENGRIIDAQPSEVVEAVGGAAEAEEAPRWFDEVPVEISEGGLAAPVAYHLLVAGDLRARAGDRRRGEALSREALRLVPGDPAFAALSSLLAGDAELGTPGAAERRLPVPAGRRTLDRATRYYATADALFREAGASRGRAAAALRLAHVARLRRRPDDRAACVERALTLAAAAGDGACAALLRVHRVLDAVEDGRPHAGPDVEEVRHWAGTAGSGSWLRGTAGLVAARAREWTRQGYAVRGREAGDLAARLAEAVPAAGARPVRPPRRGWPPADGRPLGGGPMTGSPGTYHDARHRLASLVHADLALRGREGELEDEIRAAGGPGAARGRVTVPMVSSWLSTVLAAELFLHEAVGLGDPDLVAAARPRLARVIDLGERLRGGTDAGAAAERVVREHLAAVRTGLHSTHAVEILHRLRRHRAAGLPAEAEHTAREAAALVARGAPASAARCALLVELGRLEQARAEADELEARGALTALQSAALRLRLRQPERAATARRRTGVDGTGHGGTGYGGTGYGGTRLDGTGPRDAGYGGTGPDGVGPGGTGSGGSGPGRPWEVLAVEAEAALALGDPGRAAGRAAEAIGVFEEHRSRMGRDTLRAASADDPVVARLHHTAVLSQWDLPGGRALAFATVERTRSGFLEAVHTLDSAAGQPAERRAVRGWLQAEARWAARFEEAADALRDEGTGRASPHRPEPAGEAGTSGTPYGPHLTEAEQDLGAAEDRVRRLAPAALAARWGHRAVPDADAVARALPPDTVLLQYHLSDADLLCWAVTGGGLHAARRRCPADDLVATARRFHAACASGTDVTRAGRVLADALLGFCATLLSRHHRVLVVPPAPLALVPFHALPLRDGEVLGLTHDVSYLPAASLLTRPGHRSPDPDWREAPALLVGAPATAPERGLAPLPGTLTEVTALARMLPRHRVLTGPDADRRSVLAQGAGCAVLHLATHGDVRELTPYLSRMALAGPDHLGVDDLLGPDLDPALVVMSACDTGRGTATAGGDVLGLTRTAVISGARHAVVSLWPVDDITGCLVITRMYRHLTSADRPPVGTALARAQREVRAASLDEREEEYARLAERAGHAADATGPRTRTRARDSGPRTVPETTDPNHPNHWAPFVHVGP